MLSAIAGDMIRSVGVPDETAEHGLAVLVEPLRRIVFAFTETYARG